jgi:hypothetical protein
MFAVLSGRQHSRRTAALQVRYPPGGSGWILRLFTRTRCIGPVLAEWTPSPVEVYAVFPNGGACAEDARLHRCADDVVRKGEAAPGSIKALGLRHVRMRRAGALR